MVKYLLVFAGGSELSQRRYGDGGVRPPVREGKKQVSSFREIEDAAEWMTHRRPDGQRCENNSRKLGSSYARLAMV